MTDMTVGSVKNHEIYKSIDSVMANIPLHKRILPLFKTIVIIKNKSVRNKEELWIKTGEIERACDKFYVEFEYSEKFHKEHSDFLYCIVMIIKEYEKEQFSLDNLNNLVMSFTKISHKY